MPIKAQCNLQLTQIYQDDKWFPTIDVYLWSVAILAQAIFRIVCLLRLAPMADVMSCGKSLDAAASCYKSLIGHVSGVAEDSFEHSNMSWNGFGSWQLGFEYLN